MTLYQLSSPAGAAVPVVADIPHSGREIPRAIQWQFKRELRRRLPGLDRRLDELYDFLPELGITILRATHSRYVVDLNRDWRNNIFGQPASSVIYRETLSGDLLYDIEPPEHELNDRIVRYYLPYHRQLADLLEECLDRFGRVLLLDLHSFGTDSPDADIVLGDVNGKSCNKALTDAFERAFRNQGFSVARNERWTGGYITRHYSKLENIQALQMEIKFRAYLDAEDYGTEELKDPEKLRLSRERLKAAFSEALANLPG